MLNVLDFEGALDRDVVQAIILSQAADLTPIYATLTAAGRTRETKAEKFEWYTSTLAARRSAINNGGAAYDAEDTALVVDDATVYYPNAVILAEATGEIMLVTAVNTGTDTITVVRGIGSVVAAHADSVANNAVLTVVGPAMGEASEVPGPRHTGASNVHNYVQTYRKAVQLSGRMDRSATLTEGERARQRAAKMREMVDDFEHSLLFGAVESGAEVADADGKRVTTSGGFLQAITTHVDAVDGTVTLARFDEFAEIAFERGSREKFLFAGATLVSALHTLYRDKMTVASLADAAGLRLSRVRTPYGDFLLQHHRGLAGAYAGHGVAVDPEQAELRIMQGGEPNLRADVKKDGVDGMIDEWWAEWGLQWGSEDHHAVISGVSGAA